MYYIRCQPAAGTEFVVFFFFLPLFHSVVCLGPSFLSSLCRLGFVLMCSWGFFFQLFLLSSGFNADGYQRLPCFIFCISHSHWTVAALCCRSSLPAFASPPSKSPGKIITCKMAFIGQKELQECFTQPPFFLINASQLGSAGVRLGPLTTSFSSTGILGTKGCEVYFCQGEA